MTGSGERGAGLASLRRDDLSHLHHLEVAPRICFSVLRALSFHRGSGAPEMNQSAPLSARNMPYFLSARIITCASVG